MLCELACGGGLFVWMCVETGRRIFIWCTRHKSSWKMKNQYFLRRPCVYMREVLSLCLHIVWWARVHQPQSQKREILSIAHWSRKRWWWYLILSLSHSPLPYTANNIFPPTPSRKIMHTNFSASSFGWKLNTEKCICLKEIAFLCCSEWWAAFACAKWKCVRMERRLCGGARQWVEWRDEKVALTHYSFLPLLLRFLQ